MSSFKAKLTVAGKDYPVLECSYSLHREADAEGMPSSVTRGGKIRLTIVSDSKTELFEWMCDSWQTKDGSVVFLKPDSDATLKELKFKKAYMVDFEERFSSSTEKPMQVSFTISAQEINLGNGKHINQWISS
jgi:hypothetical protein